MRVCFNKPIHIFSEKYRQMIEEFRDGIAFLVQCLGKSQQGCNGEGQGGRLVGEGKKEGGRKKGGSGGKRGGGGGGNGGGGGGGNRGGEGEGKGNRKHKGAAALLAIGFIYSAEQIRDRSQQRRFRKKEDMVGREREASHIIPLNTVKVLLKGMNLKEEIEKVKEWLNDFANFEKVDRYTNRSVHTKADNALLKKYKSDEPLTEPLSESEETRAEQQANTFLQLWRTCPRQLRVALVQYFTKLNDYIPGGNEVLMSIRDTVTV